MAAGETTKLTINIDIARASVKAQKLARELKAMGAAGGQAGVGIKAGMQQASQGMTMAADASAAAQIRFQTMTQGMLNLSTTAVQTFTSISNLARAQNRAAASVVGAKRAQDALNRFQIKYNMLLESGSASTRALTQAQNELNTAMDDYAVKADKAKIETEAVLDIQLLFAANIVNVGVSSFQVFSTMVGKNTKAMIANTISTRFNSLARFNNSNSLFGNTIQNKINTLAQGRQALATTGATFATRGQTIALRALKIALGPIGLIFIGISAAMAAYETNAFGLKDTLNDLLGIQDELGDTMDDGRGVADDFAKALLDVDSVAGGKLPTSFAKLQDAVNKYRNDLRKGQFETEVFFNVAQNKASEQRSIEAHNMLLDFQSAAASRLQTKEELDRGVIPNILGNKRIPALLGGLQIFANFGTFRTAALVNNKRSSTATTARMIEKAKSNGGTDFNLDSFALDTIKRNKLVADADTVTRVFTELGYNIASIALLPQKRQKELVEKAIKLGTFQDVLASDDLQREYARLLNEQLSKDNKPNLNFLDFPNISNIIGQEALLFQFRDFGRLGFLSGLTDVTGERKDKRRIIPAFIAALLRSGNEHLVSEIPVKDRDFILTMGTGKPQALNRRLEFMISQAKKFSVGERVDARGLSGIGKNKPADFNQLIRFLAFSGLDPRNKAQMFLAGLGISPTFTDNGTQNIIISGNVSRTLKDIEASGSVMRAQVFLETGIDIGRVADVISEEDAFRIGKLEAVLRTGNTKDIREAIQANMVVTQFATFKSGDFVKFGRFNFFGNSGINTGKAGFEGLSATAAFQLTSNPSSLGSIEHHRNKVAMDSFIKSGKKFEQDAIRAAIFGVKMRNRTMGRSEADSALVAKITAQIHRNRFFNETILAGFGGGQFNVIGAEITEDLFEIGFRLSQAPDFADKRIGAIMLRLGEKAVELQGRLINATSIGSVMAYKQEVLRAVVRPALALVGLDTQFTQKITKRKFGKNSPFSASFQRRHRFQLTGKSPLDFLREDLGLAGREFRDIRIPAPSRALMAKALIFAQNKFSDFNDMNIAGNAIDVLVGSQGITRQQVWDIRFNTTKGDRELFNRLRFEEMHAASTGTSTI